MYDSMPGDLAAQDLVDAKGTQWHGFSALASTTLATSVVASKVPISFVLQDQVLLSAWVWKDMCDDQVAALRQLQ